MKTEESCPYCNKHIPLNSAFCVNCGQDLRFYEKPVSQIEQAQPDKEETSVFVNCSYCQKASPEGSKFCVYCGREVHSTVKDEVINSATKKISSVFNILLFLAAIASIGGFIYFYVENKISTPADKNPLNEEIVGNLYRNTKYQFRIKFPESWDIKKGDGPNILVKAASGEGSSINIYVKDSGIELGDIDDLMSLEEWANSIIEKFPSAKIISQKELYIDNRKAYFVQYSVNYKTLDNEMDGIFYNVGFINKNYTYVITAGSEESKFEDEKEMLDQSVRTFVIEEYGTNISSQGKNPNFQSDNVIIKKEKKEKITENANQPWFRNSLLGISFETPQKLEEQSAKPPSGYEDYITKIKSYFSKENDLIIFFMYAESKFDTYDKETGLNGAIGNMVNSMNGTELNLKFNEPKNNYDDLICNGSFKLKGVDVQVKGYVYWNGKGKFFTLTIMGDKKDIKSMDKIIESLRINLP